MFDLGFRSLFLLIIIIIIIFTGHTGNNIIFLLIKIIKMILLLIKLYKMILLLIKLYNYDPFTGQIVQKFTAKIMLEFDIRRHKMSTHMKSNAC